MNIGTWNVQGLKTHTGKLTIIEKELARYSIDIAGLAETHWLGEGYFRTENGNYVYFSGSETQVFTGVAILVSPRVQKSVIEFRAVSDRIVLLKLESKPHKLNIIQVYLPTTTADDSVVEEFYRKLQVTIKQIPGKEPTLICGDFNAQVGSTTHNDDLKDVLGKYGIGTRNERGDRLIEFAIANKYSIMNTQFKQHIRRLYTWKSPGDRSRNQIDYILTNSRWRSSIQKVRSCPGAICGSDHILLKAKLKLKLKACHQRTEIKKLEMRNKEDLLQEIEKTMPSVSNGSSQEIWEAIKYCVITPNKPSTINTSTKQKHWITDETFQIIENRRKLCQNGVHSENEKTSLRNLNKEIKRRCKMDKRQYYSEICKEIESHDHNNQPRDLFKKIRYITREFKARTWAVEDHTGVLRTNKEEIAEAWRSYCQNLYKDDQHLEQSHQGFDEMEEEPDILESEVKLAINKLKLNKAPGPDMITAEILKATEETGIKLLHLLCNKIWHSRQWPKDWTQSTISTIHKKGSFHKCDNYRTISLISHASKIMLQIINERLKAFLQKEIPEEQAGFAKGRGTREHLLNIRQIIEKSREFNIPLYICFIDYRKAFDKVKWSQLWRVLKEAGVPQHLISLITELYKNTTGSVKVLDTISNEFHPEKGVRQGCILSPQLFNIYGEHIMRRALERWKKGISINGRRISNLRFADDTVLLTNSQEDLIDLIRLIEKESQIFGLELNISKTKVMIVDRQNNNHPQITKVDRFDVVNSYLYLGSLITNTGTPQEEIKRRCDLAKVAMGKLTKIWKDPQISKTLKMRLVNCLVFPILTYGCESWTMRQSERRKVDATEMFCWRRMLRIPWTDYRTNDSILKELRINKRLVSKIQLQQLRYFGHVMRSNRDNMERLIIQGKVEGRRSRGRSPTRWIDQLTGICKRPMYDLIEMTRDREKWRRVIHDVTTTTTLPPGGQD